MLKMNLKSFAKLYIILFGKKRIINKLQKNIITNFFLQNKLSIITYFKWMMNKENNMKWPGIFYLLIFFKKIELCTKMLLLKSLQ
jgi:hypothetical protein